MQANMSQQLLGLLHLLLFASSVAFAAESPLHRFQRHRSKLIQPRFSKTVLKQKQTSDLEIREACDPHCTKEKPKKKWYEPPYVDMLQSRVPAVPSPNEPLS